MDEERQRIKIAEACGWTILEPEVHPAITYDWGLRPGFTHTEFRAIVPDYLNDLNAMHDAEKTKFNENYWFEWENVVARMSLPRGTLPLTIWIARMTAAQHAEAFLKTLNLWEE